MALAGGALSIGAVAGSGSAVVLTTPFPGAWRATAGLGPVEVERLERAIAPAHAGHAEAPGDMQQVTAWVTVTNRQDRDLPYSAGQFRLRRGGADGSIGAIEPRRRPVTIRAGETLRERVSFLVPAGDDRFALVFTGVGERSPTLVELGAIPGAEED